MPTAAEQLAQVKAIRLGRALDSFSSFAKDAWEIIEPGVEVIWTWYLQTICDAKEAQIRGDLEYRKLVICIPPGTAKSTIINVLAPAWQWLREPTRRKLHLSNDEKLAERDSRNMRTIVTSQWYRSLIVLANERDPKLPVWSLSKDQAAKVNFSNTIEGFRQSYSINAKLIGKRAHDIDMDDLVDAKQVILGSIEQVTKRLAEVNDIVDKTLPSRVNRMATACWTLIMQRLHEDDPASKAIAKGWKLIKIAMEYDPEDPDNHPDDPRTEKGELLNTELFPADEIEKLRDLLGLEFDAQYNQDPKPRGGGILKERYWCYWYPPGMPVPQVERTKKQDGTMHTHLQMELPDNLLQHSQSWDLAVKDTAAYVVGQVWATLDANAFLLDQVRDRLDIIATIDALLALSKKWPQAISKLIEDKANGPAVMRMLRGKVTGLEDFEPKGSKEERAMATVPLMKAGNVWIPHPAMYPWVKEEFLPETRSFPGKYKDQVDAMVQFLLHWQGDGFFFI